MKGCVLYGRFVFSNPAKNRPARADATNKPKKRPATQTDWDDAGNKR